MRYAVDGLTRQVVDELGGILKFKVEHDPLWGDLIVFPNRVVAKEIVQFYRDEDKHMYKPATEIERMTQFMQVFPPPISWEHPHTDTLTSLKEPVGFVRNPHYKDGRSITDLVYVRDWLGEDRYQDLIMGKKPDVSIGFFYEDDMTEGEFDGMPYQSAQRGIYVNHIATTSKGRCSTEEGCGLMMRYDSVLSEGKRFGYDSLSLATSITKDEDIPVDLFRALFDKIQNLIGQVVAGRISEDRFDREDDLIRSAMRPYEGHRTDRLDQERQRLWDWWAEVEHDTTLYVDPDRGAQKISGGQLTPSPVEPKNFERCVGYYQGHGYSEQDAIARCLQKFPGQRQDTSQADLQKKKLDPVEQRYAQQLLGLAREFQGDLVWVEREGRTEQISEEECIQYVMRKTGKSRTIARGRCERSNSMIKPLKLDTLARDDALQECVSREIPKIKEADPEKSEDQQIAIAYSKCRERLQGDTADQRFKQVWDAVNSLGQLTMMDKVRVALNIQKVVEGID